MEQTKEAVKFKGNAGRAFAGIFLSFLFFAVIAFLLFWAYSYGMENSGKKDGDVIMNWIATTVACVLLLLYLYGWLGAWLMNLEDSRNKVLRFIGKIFGAIGLFIRPYAIRAFGANKKKVYLFAFALPLAVLGVLSIILGIANVEIFAVPSEWSGNWSGYYILFGVAALLNSLFALLTKKCPDCGCLMGKISNDTLSYKAEAYTTQASQQVGYISDGAGNTVDVYQTYDVERSGYADTQVKTFTCLNCGAKTQGRAHTIHHMDINDPRRYA